MHLSRLIYASRPGQDFCPESLNELASRSSSNNINFSVSGMLVYDGYEFLQALEGDRPVIRKIFEMVKRDSRHGEVHIISCDGIEHREFLNWGMNVLLPQQEHTGSIWTYRPDKPGHHFHEYSPDEAMRLLLAAAHLSRYFSPFNQSVRPDIHAQPASVHVN